MEQLGDVTVTEGQVSFHAQLWLPQPQAVSPWGPRWEASAVGPTCLFARVWCKELLLPATPSKVLSFSDWPDLGQCPPWTSHLCQRGAMCSTQGPGDQEVDGLGEAAAPPAPRPAPSASSPCRLSPHRAPGSPPPSQASAIDPSSPLTSYVTLGTFLHLFLYASVSLSVKWEWYHAFRISWFKILAWFKIRWANLCQVFPTVPGTQ